MVLDYVRQQPPLLLPRQYPLDRQAPDRFDGPLRYVPGQFPFVNPLLIFLILILNLNKLPSLRKASVLEAQNMSYFTQSSLLQV